MIDDAAIRHAQRASRTFWSWLTGSTHFFGHQVVLLSTRCPYFGIWKLTDVKLCCGCREDVFVDAASAI